MTVEIDVSKRLDASLAEAQGILRRWREYPSWWPLRVDVVHDRTALAVRPVAFMPFVAITMVPRSGDGDDDDAGDDEALTFDYVRGPFRGEGVWRLSESDSVTCVSYGIRLDPVNRLVAAAASTPFFRWKHCRDIERIIEHLDRAAKASAVELE